MIRAACGAGLLALALSAPAGASAGWSYDAELGAGYDTNVGNAGTSPDKREAASIDATVAANYSVPFSLYTALQLRGSVAGEAVTNVDKLSNARSALRLRLLHKPGEGFYVPVLAAWTSGGYRASASDLRSASEWRAGAYLSEPVTTQIQARAGFAWLKRAAESRVFDGETKSYELDLDWAPTPRVRVYGGYRVDRGPMVVSADGMGVITPKTEHLILQNVADRIEQDDAFGDTWFAFRVNARTGIATLGTNVLLSKDWSLDVQVLHADASVDYAGGSYGGGPGPPPAPGSYTAPGYERWIGGLSLLLRF